MDFFKTLKDNLVNTVKPKVNAFASDLSSALKKSVSTINPVVGAISNAPATSTIFNKAVEMGKEGFQSVVRSGINVQSGVKNVVSAGLSPYKDKSIKDIASEAGKRFVASPVFNPETKVEQAITGKKTPFSFQTAKTETSKFLTEIGVSQKQASRYAMPLVLIGSLSDVIPGGAGKKGAQEAITSIAKNTDSVVNIAEDLIKTFKFAKKEAEELAPQLLKVTDDNSVKTTIENFLESKIKGGITETPTIKQTGQESENVIPQNLSTYTDTVPPTDDPVNAFIDALKKAPKLRGQQEAIYTKERGQRLAKFMSQGKDVSGEAGFKTQRSALGGEYTKVQFQPIRELMTQKTVDSIFDKVKQSDKLGDWEKISAQGELLKIFDGQVPTRSGINKLNQVFGNDFVAEILDKRNVIKKVGDTVLDVLNIPRAIMSSLDLSAPFRQGIFMVGRPKEFFSAFKPMFKSFGSQKAFEAVNESIFKMPAYTKMRDAGLAISDIGDDIIAREEAFASRLVGKLPGIKGSGRAYTAFLNKVRADNFQNLYNKAQQAGVDVNNEEFLRSLASFINSGTGRGSMPKALEGIAPILNTIFFSPRLMASRLNLLNPQFYYKQSPFVRKEMLKTAAGTGAFIATILGIAKMSGAEVGTDPRSSDFAKIKIGNTRYDVSGGFQQYIKLATQLATGKIVSSTSGRTMTLGEGYKPLTRGDIIARFFQNKESPIASFVSSWITGVDSVGNKFEVAPEVIDRVVPMMAQDMYDLYQEKGLMGIPMALPGLFGVGSQTYGKQEVVFGKNKIGQPGVEIINKRGLGKTVSDSAKKKFLGKDIKTSGTSTSNIETWYEQMSKLPKEEGRRAFEAIKKVDPELAKRINKVIADKKAGITVDDKVLKNKGVQSGDRATAIYKELNKLKTKEEKAKLWNDYVKKKVITPDVATQLKVLIKNNE